MTKTKNNYSNSILYIDGVTVSFDGFKALNNLSFTVPPKSIQAIVGPNGAGKTTFMDVVTGRTKPTNGRVIFKKNINLFRFDETAIVGLGIARKFQRPSIFPNHTVLENLELAAYKNKNILNTIFFKNKNMNSDLITKIAVQVNLDSFLYVLAGSLSHGQKQWLEIGMLLSQDCNVLMLDEPVAGMTDEETEKTSKLFRKISTERSLIVIEHDIDFVQSLKCPVTVLHEGAVLAQGNMKDLKNNASVIEVYLGR